MRRIAAFVFASSLLCACEKPRERACRSLFVQANNADDARVVQTPDPRLAAHRAQSAARWLRSNAVEDADLKKDAEALAAALDRLADARLRLVDASQSLGATDSADLVARAERVSAYLAAAQKTHSIRRGKCPYDEGSGLIEDPRCMEYVSPSCAVQSDRTPLALEAAQCAESVERFAHVAEAPSEAEEVAKTLRATEAWAKSLPAQSSKVTVEHARAVPHVIADRGRADAEIAELVASLRAKCGP